MIEQIKQALENTTVDGHREIEDNASEWLRYLIGEVERLQKIEKEHEALTDIIDRARKLAYQQSPDEDMFYLDNDGKLCRRSETT